MIIKISVEKKRILGNEKRFEKWCDKQIFFKSDEIIFKPNSLWLKVFSKDIKFKFILLI